MRINGAELLAAVPVFAGRTEPDHFVVVVQRTTYGCSEYVSATVATLADETWHAGHYYETSAGALADMYVRADVTALTRDDYVAASRRDVISR
jgi:hypothetical protein